jgi:hypothetical protein
MRPDGAVHGGKVTGRERSVRRGRAFRRSRAVRRLRASVAAAVLLLASAASALLLGADRRPALGPRGEIAVPPFGVGERLTFDIKYGIISAGVAVIGIPEIAVERGKDCYHIVSVAESNAFFSVFFPVRDVVESYLDVRELVSLKFEKRLSEGDFRAHDLVLLDHDRHVAVYPGSGEERDRLVPLSLDAQDILSSLYYVRMVDLEVGESVYIENHADKKNYPLEIRVLGRERVDVPAGTFDCLVVEPIMRTAGLFRHKGSLKVWLTDDDRRVPVLMRSKVIIGSVSAVLTTMELPDGAPSGAS